MIPYVLLLAIPALFAFVAVDDSRSRRTIRIGKTNDSLIREHNLVLPVFFVALLLLLVLRHETLGLDLQNYKIHFEVFREQKLKDFDLLRIESLFRLACWLVGQFTDNYYVWLILVAIACVVPVAKVYCEERRYAYMQIAIFVSMSTFVIMFSALRQAITVALGMIAYRYVKEKKPIPYLITIVIALGFHHSAFMLLFFYPLYYLRLKKTHLWFIVPIVAAVFIFNRQIFFFMTLALAFIGEEYELTVQLTGSYTMLLLFAVFAVFSYVIPDEEKMDDEMFGLRNFLLMALMLQCLSPIHPLAMRMNYYFIIFIPIAMAKFAAVPRAGMERVAKLAVLMISAYFTFDFLYKTYQSCVTGVSALGTIPYRFFWMG